MIALRDARPADLDAIRDLHTQSWHTAYAPFVPSEALDALPDAMADRWSELPDDVICAVEDGRLVGFVRLKSRQGWPYIDNLHALPDRRGQGIGTRLIRAVGARLAERGEGRVWLTVIAENRDARRFYARQGGIEAGPGIEPVLGHPTEIVAVVWPRLAPLLTEKSRGRAERA